MVKSAYKVMLQIKIVLSVWTLNIAITENGLHCSSQLIEFKQVSLYQTFVWKISANEHSHKYIFKLSFWKIFLRMVG